MEWDAISTAISAVGFPIFCTVCLGFFVWKAFQMVMNNNKERESKLYETITDVRGQLKTASETNAGFLKVLESMSKDIEDIKDKLKEL